MVPVALFLIGLLEDRNMLFVSSAFLIIFAVVNDLFTLSGMVSLLTLTDHIVLFGALVLGLLCRYLLRWFWERRQQRQ